MGTICKIGETKEIRGKLYRKAAASKNRLCTGRAFLNDGKCPGGSVGDAIEDGGAECLGTIWKQVSASAPIDRTKAPKAKAAKHVWTPKSFMPHPKSTKAHLEQLLSATVSQLNDLGTENAKLKNQIASLKKKGPK